MAPVGVPAQACAAATTIVTRWRSGQLSKVEGRLELSTCQRSRVGSSFHKSNNTTSLSNYATKSRVGSNFHMSKKESRVGSSFPMWADGPSVKSRGSALAFTCQKSKVGSRCYTWAIGPSVKGRGSARAFTNQTTQHHSQTTHQSRGSARTFTCQKRIEGRLELSHAGGRAIRHALVSNTLSNSPTHPDTTDTNTYLAGDHNFERYSSRT